MKEKHRQRNKRVKETRRPSLCFLWFKEPFFPRSLVSFVFQGYLSSPLFHLLRTFALLDFSLFSFVLYLIFFCLSIFFFFLLLVRFCRSFFFLFFRLLCFFLVSFFSFSYFLWLSFLFLLPFLPHPPIIIFFLVFFSSPLGVITFPPLPPFFSLLLLPPFLPQDPVLLLIYHLFWNLFIGFSISFALDQFFFLPPSPPFFSHPCSPSLHSPFSLFLSRIF